MEMTRLSQHYGESGHPQFFGILPHLKHWRLPVCMYFCLNTLRHVSYMKNTLHHPVTTFTIHASLPVFYHLATSSQSAYLAGKQIDLIFRSFFCSSWHIIVINHHGLLSTLLDPLEIISVRYPALATSHRVKCGSLYSR